MSLGILRELRDQMTRLAIAGSALAAGDPCLMTYIPRLRALGEKAPVFKNLADLLESLIAAGAKDSPDALMDVWMLLSSLSRAQGAAETGASSPETRAWAYAEKPLPHTRLSYSLMTRVKAALEDRGHLAPLKALFASGGHRDPRLFALYCRAALAEPRTRAGTYAIKRLIPGAGTCMIPFIAAALKTETPLTGGIKKTGWARLGTLIRRLQWRERFDTIIRRLAPAFLTKRGKAPAL